MILNRKKSEPSAAVRSTVVLPTDDNHKWLMRCLAMACSKDELEQIVIDIRCDQFESEDWTSDETKSSQLRSYFLHRCRLLGIDPASFKETEE